MILTDNDGVLTDGGLIFGKSGIELAKFDVKDGLGLKLARDAGLKTGIISGLKSPALEKRAAILQTDELHMSCMEKLQVYEKIKKKHNLEDREITFIGDDIIDLPIMLRCGLPVAVSDAHEEVRKIAHYVTTAPGGNGAIREIVDMILKAQGHWQKVMAKYYS